MLVHLPNGHVALKRYLARIEVIDLPLSLTCSTS